MNSYASSNRTADPWPRWPQNEVEWDILDWQVIKRCIRYQRYIDAHPPRPFPALVWLDEHQEKPVLRIDTSKLPVIPLAFWQEEQRQEQERIQEEWALAQQEVASYQHPYAFTQSPWPGEKPLTRKQRLGKWLDAHRGALNPRFRNERWVR